MWTWSRNFERARNRQQRQLSAVNEVHTTSENVLSLPSLPQRDTERWSVTEHKLERFGTRFEWKPDSLI